jgi:hypothetical protein
VSFQLRELGKNIEQEPTGSASPVTPEYPSRPQTPESPKLPHTSTSDSAEIVTPAGLGIITLVTMTQEQLNQILIELHRPSTNSNPKVEDLELYHGERTKLRAFLTQCELKFNCEGNRFDTEQKKVNYASSRYRGNTWAWIKPSIKEGKSVYTTWDTFKTAISRAFREANSKEIARRKFKMIRQGAHSAVAY